VGAHEQLGPELAFQRVQPPGRRRLRQRQDLGGAAQASRAGRLDEDLELTEQIVRPPALFITIPPSLD
jgi:hypothetical protein